jgi:tetratricopeptide (TPR) repeat protein
LGILQKDYNKAIENYTVAIEKDPDNSLYKFYLGAAIDRLGRREEATKILEDVVASSPDFPEAYNYLGYLYAEAGLNLDRAIILIKKALEFDPKNGAYVDSLGWAYYKKGMLEEDLPDDATIRDHLGDAYFAKDEPEKALLEWEESLKLNPENQTVKEKLERVQKELKTQR